MRRLLGALGVGAACALFAAGGWYLWQLQLRQRQTLARLADTQASLAQNRQQLTMLEDERRKLAGDYDTLRGRWTASDQELSRLKQETGRMTQQLADAHAEHATIAKDLEQSKQEQAALRARLDALQQDVAGSEARKAELESQLKDAASSSLTPAEVEQLGAALAKQQDEQDRLRGQLVELSRAYEAVAVPAPAPPAAAGSKKGRPAPAEGRAAAETAPSVAAVAAAAQQQATRYRLLGEAFLASHRYAEAADAFEQSLTYVDDPAVHTHLAFLYGRVLNDTDKALLHRAQAPAQVDPAAVSLGAVARADALPRSSRKLLWDWLTK